MQIDSLCEIKLAICTIIVYTSCGAHFLMNKQDNSTGREIAILDSVNEGVFTVDLDWRITAFNKSAERITGVSKKSAIGSLCCDVFHADVCEQNCPLRQTLDTGKPTVNATANIINQHGEKIPIRISTAMLKNRNGKIVGGVESFQDLTPH